MSKQVDKAEPNLLIDGSFETAKVGANEWSTFDKVGGWQSNAGIEVWGKGFITKASDGNQAMELDAGSDKLNQVWQDVSTEKGASYTFTFDYAQRADTKAATNTIEVWWNGQKVGKVEPGSTDWSKGQFTVTGTGGKDRIEFREEAGDNDSYGGVIDNASLVKSSPSTAEKEAEQKAKDEEAKKLAEAKAAEEAKHKAEEQAKQEAAKKEAEAKAAEEAKHKAEEQAKEEAAKKEAEAKAAEEAKHKAEEQAKEEAAKKEAEAKAAEEAKHKAEEQAKEEAAKKEAEAKAAEEAKHKAEEQAKEEAAKKEAEAKAAEEAKHKAEEQAKEEAAKKEAEAKAAEEAKHKAEEQAKEEAAKKEAEAKAAEEAKHKAEEQAKEEAAKKEAEAKAEEEKKHAEEKAHEDEQGHGNDDHGPDRGIMVGGEDIFQKPAGLDLVGTDGNDAIDGSTGGDHIRGLKGDDVINGDDGAPAWSDLKIVARMTDSSDPDAVNVLISNLPKGAILSAGQDNGDGSWLLKGSELAGLKISAMDGADFVVKLEATAADGSGLKEHSELQVHLSGGMGDFIEGGRGADVIDGQAGNDIIYGGSKPTGTPSTHAPQPGDDDVIHGGDGHDMIFAGSGNDKVWGDAGNDAIGGGQGDDMLSGGDGDDHIAGNSGNDMIWGDAGNDVVYGGQGNDSIWGGDGDDALYGNSGDDVFYTDGGTDSIYGGSGFDTLVFNSSPSDHGTYYVDLSKGFAGNDEVGYDTLSSIEAVIGGYGNDNMIGSTKDNLLVGGGGNDTLRGGAGADTLTGGDGNDTFVFLGKDVAKTDGTSLGMDTITDFQVGDVVDLRDMTSTRKATYSMVDDGQNSTLVASFKGHDVDVVKLEGVHGHSLEDMIKDGMILV